MVLKTPNLHFRFQPPGSEPRGPPEAVRVKEQAEGEERGLKVMAELGHQSLDVQPTPLLSQSFSQLPAISLRHRQLRPHITLPSLTSETFPGAWAHLSHLEPPLNWNFHAARVMRLQKPSQFTHATLHQNLFVSLCSVATAQVEKKNNKTHLTCLITFLHVLFHLGYMTILRVGYRRKGWEIDLPALCCVTLGRQ